MHQRSAGGTARAAQPRNTTSAASRGQSLVELALVLPALLLLLVFATDFGRAYLGWVTLNNVVREAANFAAENPTAWSSVNPNAAAQGAYTSLITNDAAGIDCTLPNPLPAPSFPNGPDGQNAIGMPATVAITCEFSPITPIISSIVGNSVPMSASAAFPIRNGVIAGIAPGLASPTITTALSQSSGSVGASVYDLATLSGATSNATGTVTYTVYADSACSVGAQDAGTVTVAGVFVPPSNSISFGSPGTYYWQAVYSGDANNNGATSLCTSEILTINRSGPMIATALSQSSVLHGAPVNDTATLSGATSDAGGTVTYTAYTNSTCTAGAQAAGTVTVSDGVVPASNSITFNTAGTYYWQATYSGDANNAAASSSCGSEVLYVDKMCTVPDLTNDKSQDVQGEWNEKGFGTTVTFSPLNPPSGTNIKSQSIDKGTSAVCVNTAITVTW